MYAQKRAFSEFAIVFNNEISAQKALRRDDV